MQNILLQMRVKILIINRATSSTSEELRNKNTETLSIVGFKKEKYLRIHWFQTVSKVLLVLRNSIFCKQMLRTSELKKQSSPSLIWYCNLCFDFFLFFGTRKREIVKTGYYPIKFVLLRLEMGEDGWLYLLLGSISPNI